jgi:hypothetical protein
MQQGRTAGKGSAPKRFTDYFSSPHPVQAKIARAISRTKKGLTAYEIQDLAECSVYSVRSVLKAMQAIKAVYICEWRRTSTTGLTAAYKVGSLPDAEKPKLIRDQVLVQKNIEQPVVKKSKEAKVIEVAPCPITQHLIALAKALVPERNEQEQREVNRLYLNWISEGIYG